MKSFSVFRILRSSLCNIGSLCFLALFFSCFFILLTAGCEKKKEEVRPPRAPTELTVEVGKKQVVVHWGDVDGALGYRLYYDLDSGLPYEGEDANEGESPIEVSGSSYTLTGLKYGITYYFAVTAFNEGGESGYSSEVAAVMVPGSPGGITAGGGIMQVSLSWDKVNGAEGYRVYYDIDSGDPYEGVEADQGKSPLDVKETGITLTGLEEGTTYYIMVKAYNKSGECGPDSEIMVTTIPPAPTLLTATAGTGAVSLSWDEAKSATSYKVYYDNDASDSPYDGTWAKEGSSPISTTHSEITLSGLTPGETYYFAVSAVNASGEGSLSQEATAVPTGEEQPPQGYRLVTGGIADFGGGSVSNEKNLKAGGDILEPSVVQGNVYRIRLK